MEENKRKLKELKDAKHIWLIGFTIITTISFFMSVIENYKWYGIILAWLILVIGLSVLVFIIYKKAIKETKNERKN